ncbi:Chromodomain-helicase-DNA-binding protein 6 [Galdieria sulphuraria]|nr:Chromodomain-helicase-DNA-binding protein 6 [Galdieria sulphuraria]
MHSIIHYYLRVFEAPIYFQSSSSDHAGGSLCFCQVGGDSVLFGRSAGNPERPLEPGDREVDCGVGDSNKLSRKHAQFKYNRNTGKYEIKCLGKNGVSVVTDEKTVFLNQESPPFPLKSRSLLQMGDCLFIFLLPIGADNPSVSFAKSRPKRDWSKADIQALRSGLVKLGFGRWKEINELTGGRLLDHSEEEISQVARSIVAKCYISARAQSERKAMLEIICDSLEGTEEEKEHKVNALIKEAEKDFHPSEKGKYLRWARKLRLLQRVQQVVHDPSLLKLKEGKLFVNTVPPAPWWRPEDDMNLVIGIYKHGYGNAEDIRKDPELGFHDRTSPSVASSSASNKQAKESNRQGDGEDDEEDFEEDEEEEENEEQETSVNQFERKTEEQNVENSVKRQDAELSSLPSFPPADAIMRRLKSVLVACMKDMVRLMKEDSKATGRKAVKKESGHIAGEADENGEGTRSTNLTKKEMTELEKLVVSYGLFYQNEGQRDWKQFALVSKLLEDKSEDVLEAAFLKLMRECYSVLEGPILGQTYAETFRAELTETQLASLETDFRQFRNASTFNLSIERSRSILESISLFRFLRLRVLPDPNLPETVKNCRKMKELPFWWRSVHDRALLYGVDRHGLNNWEAIAEDPELGFPATLEKLAQKKQNESSAVNEKDYKFPKAKICQKRFNLLLDLFISSLDSLDDSYSTMQHSASPLVYDALQFNGEILEEQPLVMVGDPRGVVEIPRKQETRELRLPFDVGCGLVILNLGHIDRRPHYYNSREIFPVGFKSVRLMQGQGRESTAVRGRFLCEVLDGGDIDEWNEDVVLSKKTFTIIERNPTVAWLKICNESEIALHSSKGVSGKIVAVSGKERFGFYDTTVLYYIERLEGCQDLEGYTRRQFPLINIRPIVIRCSTGVIEESLKTICSHIGEQNDEVFTLPEEWFSEAESRKRLRSV